MGPVETAFATYSEAVAEKDVERLVGLFDGSVLLFDAWDGWSLSGRQAWRSAVAAWFDSLGPNTVEVAFEVVQETASEGLACASALVTYTALSPDGARLRSHTERQTWVLALRAEGWRVVHGHNSVPIDLGTGKALSDG